VKSLTLYAIARFGFGVASLGAPTFAGQTMVGPGGAQPGARVFVRGIGGREIGLGLALLAASRANLPVRQLLIAGMLADAGDVAGLALARRHIPATTRWLGLATAGATAAVGGALLAGVPR
jgi:hypothetical protein